MRTSRPAFEESGAGGRSCSWGTAPPPECLPSQDTFSEDQSTKWPEVCLSKLGIKTGVVSAYPREKTSNYHGFASSYTDVILQKRGSSTTRGSVSLNAKKRISLKLLHLAIYPPPGSTENWQTSSQVSFALQML